jgi:hypothetical protein
MMKQHPARMLPGIAVANTVKLEIGNAVLREICPARERSVGANCQLASIDCGRSLSR